MVEFIGYKFHESVRPEQSVRRFIRTRSRRVPRTVTLRLRVPVKLWDALLRANGVVEVSQFVARISAPAGATVTPTNSQQTFGKLAAPPGASPAPQQNGSPAGFYSLLTTSVRHVSHAGWLKGLSDAGFLTI